MVPDNIEYLCFSNTYSVLHRLTLNFTVVGGGGNGSDVTNWWRGEGGQEVLRMRVYSSIMFWAARYLLKDKTGVELLIAEQVYKCMRYCPPDCDTSHYRLL